MARNKASRAGVLDGVVDAAGRARARFLGFAVFAHGRLVNSLFSALAPECIGSVPVGNHPFDFGAVTAQSLSSCSVACRVDCWMRQLLYNYFGKIIVWVFCWAYFNKFKLE